LSDIHAKRGSGEMNGDRIEGEEKIRDFSQLVVWQKSHTLVLRVYKASKTFPSEEKFGITSQLRRAAVSVAANIAEGFEKRSKKNKINFYNIAQGSLAELKYYLILSRDLGYHQEYDPLWKQAMDVSRLLTGLIRSVEKSAGK